MTDLDDLLNEEEEVEEGTLEEEEDGLEGLFGDDEGVEDGGEVEAPPPIPAKKGKKKASKKKASKKKASKKPANDDLDGLFDEEEEAPKPRRKKKASKKKATRKPRATSDPLGSLKAELSAIADDAGEKSQLAQLKADLRAAKLLGTKLNRFAKKAVAAAEGQDALVEKLEAQLKAATSSE